MTRHNAQSDYSREITVDMLDYCRVTDGIRLVHQVPAAIDVAYRVFVEKVAGGWDKRPTIQVPTRSFAYAVIAQAARVCTTSWHRVTYRKYNTKTDTGAELIFWSMSGQHCGSYRIPFNPLPGDATEATLMQYAEWGMILWG